jgi:hypothetical protein
MATSALSSPPCRVGRGGSGGEWCACACASALVSMLRSPGPQSQGQVQQAASTRQRHPPHCSPSCSPTPQGCQAAAPNRATRSGCTDQAVVHQACNPPKASVRPRAPPATLPACACAPCRCRPRPREPRRPPSSRSGACRCCGGRRRAAHRPSWWQVRRRTCLLRGGGGGRVGPTCQAPPAGSGLPGPGARVS